MVLFVCLFLPAASLGLLLSPPNTSIAKSEIRNRGQGKGRKKEAKKTMKVEGKAKPFLAPCCPSCQEQEESCILHACIPNELLQ